ncbi:MAG: archease [Candidatus Thermoplasmatota archaeon]
MDHTADVGIHAYGDGLEEVFEETAKAMFGIITDIDKVKKKKERKVEIESENFESLLVNFLSELIYLHEVHNELYSEFDLNIEEEDLIRLTASVQGEKIDLERHDMDTAIKAVSYHELSIDSEGDIRIIFDI